MDDADVMASFPSSDWLRAVRPGCSSTLVNFCFCFCCRSFLDDADVMASLPSSDWLRAVRPLCSSTFVCKTLSSGAFGASMFLCWRCAFGSGRPCFCCVGELNRSRSASREPCSSGRFVVDVAHTVCTRAGEPSSLSLRHRPRCHSRPRPRHSPGGRVSPWPP